MRRHSGINASWSTAFGLMVAFATSSPAAMGQSSAAGEANAESGQEAESVEEVVITGTLIKNRDFNSPSPVVTVDQTVLASTAAVSVQDLFKGLTANAGSQQANEQNALQGLSQFSLRGLGVGSTLTLVNGRRAGLAPITDGSGQLFTDSNAFPVNAIERIEVLTDGASATYGSEAVAGVVNIITRKNVEGLELTADYRSSIVDGLQVGAAFGRKFEGGRFSVFANLRSQDGAFRSDVDVVRAQDAANAFGRGNLYLSTTGMPGRFNRAIPSGATFTRGAQTLADPDCAAGGGILVDAATCSYPFIDQRRVIAEEDRIQVLAQLDYELSAATSIFSELSYSRNRMNDAIGGAVLSRTTVAGGFLVPASHPFNYFVANGATGIRYAGPAEFAANPALTAVDVIFRGRPIGAAGDGDAADDIITTFDNRRIVLGFEHVLNDDWSVTGSYTRSTNSYSRSQDRDYDAALFQAALLAGTFNPFGTAIANPTLVGRDRRSLAGNTEQALGMFSFRINDVGEVGQEVIEVIMSGTTGFSLGGGPVALAIGAQHRAVGFENTPDGRRQSGNNGRDEIERAIPYTKQSAQALFGELALPFHGRFTVQAALRYEDYGSKGGSTVDPKLSTLFNVTDGFALRASWGTSFQAPSIRQVAGTISNASVNDPPNVGSFNVTVFTSGSESLKPQSAENLNLGFVINADFGLRLSADYFTYDYEDLILAEGDPQFIVNEVRAGRLPASRVIRDPAGQLRQVFTQFLNRGDASAKGIDVNLRYEPDWFESAKLAFDAQSTIITEFRSSEFTGLDGRGDLKGSRNFGNAFGSVPDFKLNVGGTLTMGAHSLGVAARYIGSYVDDQTSRSIDSQTTVDLRYSLALSDFFGTESELAVGLINAFDEDPPVLVGRPGYDNEVHDIRGRQVYVTVMHRF